ncbi:formate dehydrogenase accessory sulfurtransferase FdhD [uncultured Veillonella sp.]|uniref:formate dehydrogenase accessory sulfurtransferase FdhD n=1 Tax=uncultured Veillonella sp. TaxID=159268 RepID=UPI0025E85197|nr:formate dehydrogenase accessory sulfurtransferase FdhD [uncultured Veillonella sp.]MDY3973147.1 formate dehydrogenase accessory sulfurtransferase FdhD [Veillonella caviae]
MYSLSDINHYTCTSYSKQNGPEEQVLDISQEVAYKLYIENKSISTLIASPHDFKDLIIGYCIVEGHVEGPEDIANIVMDRDTHRIDVSLTHDVSYYQDAAPKPRAPKNMDFKVSADEICSYGGLLDSITKAHHTSHGVHEGAIVKDGKVIAYAEDVGRHNVLDRLLGIVVTQNIDTSDKILIFSGRVPQSVIYKVNRIGVPIMCSRAMPTALGISLAEKYNITLVNVLRPDSFKCMTHKERITGL